LLESRTSLPSEIEVAEARYEDQEEWRQLGMLVNLWEREGPDALPALRKLADSPSSSLRLKVLVQDCAVEVHGRARMGEEAQLNAERMESDHGRTSREALEAWYLAARCAEPTEQNRLFKHCIDLDPSFVPARVAWLGTSAIPGDEESLELLVELLRDHPDSAEGWRLLGMFGDFFHRPEIVDYCARLEPWAPVTGMASVELLRSSVALDMGDMEGALELLESLEGQQATFMKAKAYVLLGEIAEAEDLLGAWLESHPDDWQARFDFGVLARDWLGRPSEAVEHWGHVLQLHADGVDIPWLYRVQCELGLRSLNPQR